MKHYVCSIGTLLLVLLVTGCAYMGTGSDKPNPELSAQYLASAQDLETQGDLPAAMEKYKLALTADPGNAAAEEGRQRLSEQLSTLADERYKLGMKYYSQGKYGLARNEFLTALKYRPDHPKASKMLVSREPEQAPSYVFHVVKPGESLSIIAKKYYGDYKKFNIIAKFNNIKDATMVNPGQRIMIPALEGQRLAGAGAAPDDESSYVVHALRAGESISKLAKMYYGDYKKFHIIARFNGMDDATKVSVGQKIKVPRVAGLPFRVPAPGAEPPKAEAPEATEVSMPVEALEPSYEAEEELQPSTDEQIFAYRDSGIELFNDAKYEDAVFELNKAVEATPNDPMTRGYLAKAYFESGKNLFARNDFKAAQEAFESAAQYNPKCDQCQAYIDKSILGPLLAHRTNGLEHFNKNEFKQAIAEFKQFLQSQPEDREALIYLSKSYFQQALEDYNKGQFQEAKAGFEGALKSDSSCEKCAEYITRSTDSFMESHYNRGIVYFGKEQLPAAIAEWQMIYDIDPNYKDVDQNLKKATSLLEKLERIKKTSK